MLPKTLENIHYINKHKDTHLEKFKDIDAFFISAQEIVREYFEAQKKFSDFGTFETFLKGKISYYYFCLGNYNCKYVEQISLKYNKIIFFEENNPYEQVREETTESIDSIID